MARLVQLLAASSYALTSVLILLFNKVILTTYSFKFPFTMALSHMVVGLILLQCLKSAKIIHYAGFDPTLARKALPVSLCFIANVVLGMVALKGTNIPMFATLRRLTVLMVVLCEIIVLRKRQSGMTILSVSVMVLGSFIGGWGDLQFDLYGYSMVLLNNLVTALNLVFIKKTLLDTKLASDTFGVLYYNSVISIPFLLVLVVLSGEIFSLGSYPYWSSLAFQTSFLISACMSFLMNYSTYWCTEVNSALTTSVTGQVKNVMSSFVALSMFGMKATPMLIGGLTVGLTGSMMYAWAVYKTDMARKAAQAAAAAGKGEMVPLTAASSSASAAHGASTGNLSSGASSNGTRTPADMDLSLLTDGVVNGLHTPGPSTSKHSAARYQHEKQDQSAAHSDEHLADAKMARLEAGQRSPMISTASGSSSAAPMNFPSAISVPSQSSGSALKASGASQGTGSGSIGGGGVPSSPNPLHPYNNPHKSKPN